MENGIPRSLAHELTITRGLFSAMDIIDVAYQQSVDVPKVAQLYFTVGEFLELSWIRTQVIIHPTENHWEALSREALRDDLDWQQRQITAALIHFDGKISSNKTSLEAWSESHTALIDRWHHVLANLRSTVVLNYTMFFVAIRELLDLTQTTVQVSQNQDILQEV